MKETTPALESVLVWVVCRGLKKKLLMFPFKEKEEKKHLVKHFASCSFTKHTVSPAASLAYRGWRRP